MNKETKKNINSERRAIAQQLHNAAQVGNIQEVQAIFDKHQLPIDSHRRGNTALHSALYHNQDGLLLDYLLGRGANVNAPNSKGYTPLDLAIVHCKREAKAVEKLIGAGAQWREVYGEVSSVTVDGVPLPLAFAGLTPLDVARRYNNQEVVELLTARLLQQHDDGSNNCQPVSPLFEGDSSTVNKTPTIKKWHSICPICKDTVRFPTNMNRILIDQQLLEQRFVQTINGVQTIDGNKEKSGRGRKKYIARKYLDQFVSHANGKAYEKLCGIEYHAVQNMRLRKEISESMGVLSAVQQCCYELKKGDGGEIDDGIANNEDDEGIHLENVFLIDLCSGRGLTTALGGALHDDYYNDDGDDSNGRNSSNNFFLSIDRMLPHTVPHFLQDGENRKYLSRDVMSETLFAELQEIVSEQLDLGRTPILVGMHLCGILSERAVEFFERIPSIKGIVLSPCCLPKKHEQKKGITKFTKGKVDEEFLGCNEEGGDLYNYFKWNHYLKEMVSKSTSNVKSFTDDEMHTEKNAVVVGLRK